MTSTPAPILRFDDVTVEGGHPYDTAIWGVSFELKPGELMFVRLERGHFRIPLCDAAEGLIDPLQGTVQFLATDWRARSRDQLFSSRARIGRAFDEPGWLTEMDMDDNITLALRHHTHRSDASILDEASDLARTFSLPGLPRAAPGSMRLPDLRRCACVRAFMGEPDLIILENPTTGVYPEIMPALMSSIRSARKRGAALLWTTGDWDLWTDPGIRPTLRATMSGSQMIVEKVG